MSKTISHSRSLAEMGASIARGTGAARWHNELSSDLFLRNAITCFDLHFSDGTVRRIAADSMQTTSSSTGKVYTYEPELTKEPKLSWAASLGDPAAEARTISISVRRDSIDISGMISEGFHLAGYGEVSIQIDGMDYDDRIVVLRGIMNGGLTFGDPSEPITLSLSDPKSIIDFPITPYIITKERHPNAPDSSIGLRYPLLYNEWLSVPCIRIDDSVQTILRKSGSTPHSLLQTLPANTDELATIAIGNTTDWPEGFAKTGGYVKIDDEIMEYTEAKQSTSFKYLYGVKRAAFGTEAASHSVSADVDVVEPFRSSKWMVCLANDDLAIEPYTGVRDKDGEIIGYVSDPRTISTELDGLSTPYIQLEFDDPTTYGDIYLGTHFPDNADDGIDNDDDILVDEANEDYRFYGSDDKRKKMEWDSKANVFVRVTSSSSMDLPSIIEDIVSRFCPSGPSFINLDMVSECRTYATEFNPHVIVNGSSNGESANSIEFIEESILRQFPMFSAMFKDGKYGPVIMDGRKEPVGSFESGVYPMMSRESMVQESPVDEAYNDIQIRYAYDLISGSYDKVQQLNPDNSAICERGASQIGSVSMDPAEMEFVYDDDDARSILGWMAFHSSRPSYYAEYCFSPWALINLKVGDVIRVTDSEIGFSSCRAVITSMSYVRGKVTLGLQLYPPIRGIFD